MCDQTWEGSSQTGKLSTACQRAEVHLKPCKTRKTAGKYVPTTWWKNKGKGNSERQEDKATLLSWPLNTSNDFSTKIKENKQ